MGRVHTNRTRLRPSMGNDVSGTCNLSTEARNPDGSGLMDVVGRNGSFYAPHGNSYMNKTPSDVGDGFPTDDDAEIPAYALGGNYSDV